MVCSYTYHNLDIIHCPLFYLKHYISETEFCHRLQVEPTQLDPTDRASLMTLDLKTITESSLQIVMLVKVS
jgi:hypothetical protein